MGQPNISGHVVEEEGHVNDPGNGKRDEGSIYQEVANPAQHAGRIDREDPYDENRLNANGDEERHGHEH